MNKQQFRRYLANMGWNDKEVVHFLVAFPCTLGGLESSWLASVSSLMSFTHVQHTRPPQYQAHDYGDLSYLLQDAYEQFVIDAINSSQVRTRAACVQRGSTGKGTIIPISNQPTNLSRYGTGKVNV